MKIVMFSMTPLFADKSMGGAQKQLKKVALHLARQGHQGTILCTRRSDAMEPFRWHENLEVLPIYRFKQPFPEPYATPTFNIAAAIQDTGEYLAQADVFYSHDGGLIFPYVYQDTPTVISLRSIVFSETLQSGYLFQGDALILPSEHTRAVWVNTVGRFFPDFKRRTHVIHNGLDFDVYKPTDSSAIAEQIGVDPARQRIMLYPHRPEEPKGIRQTIALADRLVNQHGMSDLRVLVPQWIDTGLSASVREFYDDLERDIAQRGLCEHFVFHEWISDSQMPAYLSLGDLTVALGNYVETFGNVPYESLACGTPVLAARVGPYRDMLAEHLPLVDYGDLDAATDAAVAILEQRTGVPDTTTQWLHENFQQADMVAAYADLILNARKSKPMPYRFTPLKTDTSFVLAPWCYISDKRVWNDLHGEYGDDPTLLGIAQFAAEAPIVASDERTFADATKWYREGYLVPLQEQATVQVYLGIGSNHDAEANLQRGVALLRQRLGRVERISSVYRSAAVANKAAAPYLNAVALVETPLSLVELKALLVRIEDDMARVRLNTDGSKSKQVSIDFDILLYDDASSYEFNGKTYELPHPDLTNYVHVLVPLADIAPEFMNPLTGQSIGELLEQSDQSQLEQIELDLK